MYDFVLEQMSVLSRDCIRGIIRDSHGIQPGDFGSSRTAHVAGWLSGPRSVSDGRRSGPVERVATARERLSVNKTDLKHILELKTVSEKFMFETVKKHKISGENLKRGKFDIVELS